jgi:hypothetical protein
MRHRDIPILIAIVIASAADGQATADTVATNAAVRAIRVVYQEVEAAVISATLRQRADSFRCEPDRPTLRVTTYADSQGVTRRLVLRAESEDQSETVSYYYDRAGHLRFAFATRGVVNGTHQEERVYYALDGTVLRRLTRLVSGPGYPFGKVAAVSLPQDARRTLCRR